MKVFTTTLVTSLLLAVPAFSAPLGEQSLEDRSYYPASITYDDAPGAGVTYSGPWTHLSNQGLYNLQSRTQSYTGVKGSEVRFEVPGALPGGVNHVTIWSSRSGDRGDGSVYCGKTLVGLLNEYARHEETSSQIVFSGDVTECSLPNGGTPYIVIKHERPNAAFLAIDAIKIDYAGH